MSFDINQKAGLNKRSQPLCIKSRNPSQHYAGWDSDWARLNVRGCWASCAPRHTAVKHWQQPKPAGRGKSVQTDPASQVFPLHVVHCTFDILDQLVLCLPLHFFEVWNPLAPAIFQKCKADQAQRISMRYWKSPPPIPHLCTNKTRRSK